MEVRLITLPDTRVAFLRHTGPYGPSGIPATWQRLLLWCGEKGLLQPPPEMFGLGWDNPVTTPPAECRYDACIAVGNGVRAEGDIGIQVIRGGLSACTDFQGTAAGIGEAWTGFCRDWLPGSGFLFDDRPCFEHYPADFQWDQESGRFGCLLCIPVRRP